MSYLSLSNQSYLSSDLSWYSSVPTPNHGRNVKFNMSFQYTMASIKLTQELQECLVSTMPTPAAISVHSVVLQLFPRLYILFLLWSPIFCHSSTVAPVLVKVLSWEVCYLCATLLPHLETCLSPAGIVLLQLLHSGWGRVRLGVCECKGGSSGTGPTTAV